MNQLNNYFNMNIDPKVGSTDYLEISVPGIPKRNEGNKIYTKKNIQVDRHLFCNNQRYGFIECKTYVDRPFHERALHDFKLIARALWKNGNGNDPRKFKFIILSGQKGLSTISQNTDKADFYNETSDLFNDNNGGIIPYTFYYLKGRRDSKRPLYNDMFEFDKKGYKDFILYLLENE